MLTVSASFAGLENSEEEQIQETLGTSKEIFCRQVIEFEDLS